MKTTFLSFTKSAVYVAVMTLLVSAKAAGTNTFAISLSTETNVYVLGEPVPLRLVVLYSGKTAIDINNPLDQGIYKVNLEIAAGTSGSFRRFLTKEEANDAKQDRARPFPELHLNPGDMITNDVRIFCWKLTSADDTDLLVFPNAGDYRIRYTVRFGSEEYVKVKAVSFIAPHDEADKEAWKWLRNQNRDLLCEFESLDYILRHTENRTRILSHFEQLVTRFPTSVSAKYVNRMLAQATSDSKKRR
jgi:hypothetical protein